jgi:hypothetical protein
MPIRISAAALFGLLLAAAPAYAQATWQTLTVPEAGFSIDLPGVPTVTEPQSSPLGERSRRYLVDLGPTAYYMSYTVYPKPVAGVTPGGLLDSSREIMLESVAGSLREEIHIRPPGDGTEGEGRELVIDGKDETVYRVRIYVRGMRVYRVMAAGPKGFETNDSAKRFFGSFRYTEPGSK